MSKDRQKIKILQNEFLEIITQIIIMSNEEEIKKEKKKALEIINKLKNHINDDIEHSGRKITALDWVIYLINQRGIQVDNKKVLEELETVIKSAKRKMLNNKKNLAKRSLYAMLPIGILSLSSMTTFVVQSLTGADARIAACISVLGLLSCIWLAKIIKKNETIWREEPTGTVKLHKNFLNFTKISLMIGTATVILSSLDGLVEFLNGYIVWSDTQGASSLFILGSLISVLAIVTTLSTMMIQITDRTEENTHTRQPVLEITDVDIQTMVQHVRQSTPEITNDEVQLTNDEMQFAVQFVRQLHASRMESEGFNA